MDLMDLRRRLMMGMTSGSLIKVDGGYLTIPTSTNDITVNHNLGVVPNFAAIWVDTADYDIIPFGCCVEGVYQSNQYTTTGTYTGVTDYKYMYQGKHSTSGNLLSGMYMLLGNQLPTDTTFHFIRGGVDWAPLDTNGNPLRYRWVVGYIPITE